MDSLSIDDRIAAAGKALNADAVRLLRGDHLLPSIADAAVQAIADLSSQASKRVWETGRRIEHTGEMMKKRQREFDALDALFAGPIIDQQEGWSAERIGELAAQHRGLSMLLQAMHKRIESLQADLVSAETERENIAVLFELAQVRFGKIAQSASLLRRLALDPATVTLKTPIADTRRAADAQIAAKREREAAEKRAAWEKEAAASAAQRQAAFEARERENIAYTEQQERELLTAWRTDPRSAPEFKRRLVNRIFSASQVSPLAHPMWRAWLDGSSDGREIVAHLEKRLAEMDNASAYMTHAFETLIRVVRITTGQPIESAQAA